MGKNKHRNKQNKHGPPSPPPGPQTPGVAVASTPSAPTTPEEAVAIIRAANDEAVVAAAGTDVEVALSAPPQSIPADLIAAAKLTQETLALCNAREARLKSLEADLADRERMSAQEKAALRQREDAVAASEHELELERQHLEELATKAQDADKTVQQREERLRVRELNAEAGFAAERRTSLQQLEVEAETLRTEVSRARTQIAEERAAWDARWRAEDERTRAEHVREQHEHETALAEARRARDEAERVQREKLARDRAELIEQAARLEEERVILKEDRDAFDVRVARKASASLEEAAAKHQDLEARLASARAERDALYEKLRQRDEAERVLGNRPLPEIKRELDALMSERDSLKEQLAKRPNQEVVVRAEQLEREKEEWEAERARLTQEHVQARAALARSWIAVTEVETLRDQKAALESGRDLLHTALEELRKDVNERIRRSDGVSPFPGCTQMDTDTALQTRTPISDDVTNLAEFCRDLQQRVAIDPDNRDKVLFYSLRDIRCFVAGLAMSHLHLLHGISGTGKTSLPLAVARAIGAGSTLVEVQAGWRDRQDLIGHFNAFERRFYETEFLQALYRAQSPRYSELAYFVVLDEMNLSHPEQYFADLLSALEQDSHLQKLDLMTASVEPAPALLRNGRTLAIPQNVWFVGTANQDETTKDFADKTYDRAHVMELPRHRQEFRAQTLPARHPVSLEALRRAFTRAQAEHAETAKAAYRFVEESFADVLGRRFRIGWGNRLERQMLEFVPVVIAAGGTVGEAVDHILATKLLRKIRDRHDTRPEDLDTLRAQITGEWSRLDPENPASRSEALVRDELRRLGAEET